MNLIRNMVKNALLVFVLVTIGFAVGKEMTLRSIRRAPADVPAGPAAGRPGQINVYYLHATVRCDTCNSIEKMTHDVLASQFAGELENGRIEWKVADFQENVELAKRYNVVSSGVIIARAGKEGKESYRSLDEVWTLNDDPAAFAEYIAKAVREDLSAASNEENAQ